MIALTVRIYYNRCHTPLSRAFLKKAKKKFDILRILKNKNTISMKCRMTYDKFYFQKNVTPIYFANSTNSCISLDFFYGLGYDIFCNKYSQRRREG